MAPKPGVGEGHVEPAEALQDLAPPCLLVCPLGHVARDGQARARSPPSSAASSSSLSDGARGQGEAVAGLGGGARGGGADARRGAGDEEHGIGHILDTACTIARESTFRPAAAATAPQLPPRGPRAQGRPRRRRRRPRRRRRARVLGLAARSGVASGAASHFKARRGGHGEGSLRHGADGGDARAGRCRRAPRCSSRPTAPAMTSSAAASAPWWLAAARAGGATSASPAPPTRPRGLPSAACPATRRGWSCGSSCWPTSG